MGGGDHRKELWKLVRQLKLEPQKPEDQTVAERLSTLLSELTDDDISVRTAYSWLDEGATRRCPGWPVALLKFYSKLK